MSLFIRLAFMTTLAFLGPSSLQAADIPEAVAKQIEEMVARCQGDKTCEQVVRKRETRAAERNLQRTEQDRLLQETDPLAYYLSLWRRYLLFVLAICGTAGAYFLVMNRLFKPKK